MEQLSFQQVSWQVLTRSPEPTDEIPCLRTFLLAAAHLKDVMSLQKGLLYRKMLEGSVRLPSYPRFGIFSQLK